MRNVRSLLDLGGMKFRLSWVSFVACLCAFQCHPVKGDWVDPDTPEAARSTTALTRTDKRKYELVFSDEFEEDGRTFQDGKDPRWTAIHKNDYTNLALHFYHEDNAYTSNGVLNITTERKTNYYKAFDEKKKKFYLDKKDVQTGMLQGWNKFCFIGGIAEFRARLPGQADNGGLWPALWMLGNLGRATYVGSSEYVWPFSYNTCDAKGRKSQEINACDKISHYGMESQVGRGSPEIDIVEAMQGNMEEKLPSTHIKRPYQSTSLQVAPGLETDRPVLGKRPREGHWYSPLEYSPANKSDLNPFFYGTTLVHKPKSFSYQADALSANTQLNHSHYDKQHIYRLEWEPPAPNGTGGHLKWYTDGEYVFGLYGKTLEFMQTEIPSEPMYFIMNTAVSSHWGFPQPCPEGCKCSCYECGNPDCACGMPTGYCDNFPASFEIDYVRVWQAKDETKHFLGCSPPHRPTEKWIKGHAERYMVEGQRRPLQDVERGGAPCTSNADCGGAKRGICNSKQFCHCKQESTGPHCLAHDGFYDADTNATDSNGFEMSSMIIPPGFVVFFVLLASGFAMSMSGSMRRKSAEAKYQPVSGVGSAVSSGPTSTAPGSYQNPANDGYAIPTPQQKDVTYCVIDGRLVDQ